MKDGWRQMAGNTRSFPDFHLQAENQKRTETKMETNRESWKRERKRVCKMETGRKEQTNDLETKRKKFAPLFPSDKTRD
jgi:hypothetical protein